MMREIKYVLAGLISFATSGCSFFDSKLVSVCEEVMKERLRSPSTYKRIEVSEHQEAITVEQWLAYWDAHSLVKGKPGDNLAMLTIEPDRKPVRFRAFISSDAANAYGTPIRSLTMCEYFSPDGNLNPHTHDVLVDGQTQSEWYIEQVKNAK